MKISSKQKAVSSKTPKAKLISRRVYVLTCLLLTFLLLTGSLGAQQPKKVPRVGFLSGGSAAGGRLEVFRQGLRELGYVEGRDIVIEARFSEGKVDRLPGLAGELVRLKVDVIVASGSGDTRAAKEATSSIPIVMMQANDPVGSGFVASLARPAGNITGLSSFSPELSGKKMEFLREVVPRLSRLAVFGTSTSPGNAQAFKEMEVAAGALGVKLQYVDVLGPKDVEPAFRTAGKGQAEAVLMNVSGGVGVQRRELAARAIKSRLPAIYERRDYVEDGGLMSYGVNLADLDRRAAVYVDKILKGAKPADLPVEQPKKFEFVINLKTAKQIGLTLPPNVLGRADRVIR